MSLPISGRCRAAIGIFATLLLAASLLHAEKPWYECYDEALRAIASKNYPLAEARLLAAMADRPQPGRKIRTYAMHFMDLYVPDYQLGLVYFQQGRFSESLAQLQAAEASGVLGVGDVEFAQMQRMKKQLVERLQPKTTTPENPTTVPEQQPPPNVPKSPAEEADALVRSAQNLVNQGRIEDAKALLANARQVDPGNKSAAELSARISRLEAEQRAKESGTQQSTEQAQKASDFQQAMKQAEAALRTSAFAQARQLAQQALALGVDSAKANDLLRRIQLNQNLAALRAAVAARDWPEAQRLSQEVAATDPSNTELTTLQPVIQKALSGMDAGQLLEEGLFAFYSGNYDQALQLLDRAGASGAADGAVIGFYSGCCYAGLAFRDTVQRDALLQKARDSFARARRLRPALRFDDRFISPRILKVFAEVR